MVKGEMRMPDYMARYVRRVVRAHLFTCFAFIQQRYAHTACVCPP